MLSYIYITKSNNNVNKHQDDLSEQGAEGGETHQYSKIPSSETEDISTNSQSSANDYENGKIVISNSCWALALNDSDSLFNNDRQKEEKIYEDLCYVTFSSAFPEVNNKSILNILAFSAIHVYSFYMLCLFTKMSKPAHDFKIFFQILQCN